MVPGVVQCLYGRLGRTAARIGRAYSLDQLESCMAVDDSRPMSLCTDRHNESKVLTAKQKQWEGLPSCWENLLRIEDYFPSCIEAHGAKALIFNIVKTERLRTA